MKLKIAFYTRERLYSVDHQVCFLEIHDNALCFAEPGFVLIEVAETNVLESIAEGIPIRVPLQTVAPIKKE